MFSFRKEGNENYSELREFTLNLLTRTRPYLNEKQIEVVADDLISRVQQNFYVEHPKSDSVNQPFKFSAKHNIERKDRPKDFIPNSRKTKSCLDEDKENVSDCGSANELVEQYSTSHQRIPRKRTHKSIIVSKPTHFNFSGHSCSRYRTSNTQDRPSPSDSSDQSCSRKRGHNHAINFISKNISDVSNSSSSLNNSKLIVTSKKLKQPINKNTIPKTTFQNDIKAGAPLMKKTRLTEVYNSGSSSTFKEPDVFERLYTNRRMSGCKPVCNRTSWVEAIDPPLNKKDNPKDSLDVCVGSVQRALENLNFETKKCVKK